MGGIGDIMKKIYKYKVGWRENVTMPFLSKVIHFSHSSDGFHIWAEVDPEQIPISYKFKVIATGDGPEDGYQHKMTTILDNEEVYHLYYHHFGVTADGQTIWVDL
jgi:hypothetical protein